MRRIKTLIIILILTFLLASCGKLRKAGTYEGTGQGRNGDIKVSVTINSNGKIEDIEILEHSENKEFLKASFYKLKKNMIDQNTYEVDIISGATSTSNGIIEAVQNAVEQSN